MNIHDHEAERGHSIKPEPEVLALIPPLYATDGTPKDDKLAYVHLFVGGSDWYVFELEQETWLAFGWVCLNGDTQNAELGYFDLNELASVRANGRIRFMETGEEGAYPVYVERELGFQPTRFGDLDIAH